MTHFHLSANDLAAIATLRHATPATKDEVETTPILGYIKITVTEKAWRAIATDRYIVAEIGGTIDQPHETGLPDEDTHIELVVHRDALQRVAKWAATITKEHGAAPGVQIIRLELNDDLITVTANRETQTLVHNDANYPPVERLFKEQREHMDSIIIDPDKLARLSKVHTPELIAMRPADRRAQSPLELNFSGTNEYGVPQQILVTREISNAFNGHYRALLMPNRRV